jgi:hypothetical protein
MSVPRYADGTPVYAVDNVLIHIITSVDWLLDRVRSLQTGEFFSQRECQLLWDTYDQWAQWRRKNSPLTTLHFEIYKKLQKTEFGLPQELKDQVYTKRNTVWAY